MAILFDQQKEIKLYHTSPEPDLKLEKSIVIDDNNLPKIFALSKDAIWSVCQCENEGILIRTISLWSEQGEEDKSFLHKLDSSTYHETCQVHSFHLNDKNLLVILKNVTEFSYHVYRLNNQISLTKVNSNTFKASNQAKEGRINIDGSLICLVDHDDGLLLINVNTNNTFNYSCSSIESSHVLWSLNEALLFGLIINGFATLFICNEKSTTPKMYTQIALDQDIRLIGLKIPTVYLYENNASKLISQNIEEFEGLQLDDISLIINYASSGVLDLNKLTEKVDRSSSIKTSKKLWLNLAKTAVKTRDIQTGLICMSKLKNARVVQDIEQCSTNNPKELKALALLAMNLHLYNEAEKFLLESGDKHALSHFYQSRNEWKKAIDCVDKLNYKNLCYNYAKYLENEEGNLSEAIKYYQLSGTHVFEVPRMLFDVEDNSILESYCIGEASGSCEPEDNIKLIQWWGQYCESIGDINKALIAYEKADDYYNLVRLLCYADQTERACSILSSHLSSNGSSSSIEAAMLHLGRHLQTSSPLEAISYYLSSGAVSHAIRVCQEQGLIKDLAKIIINFGSKEDGIDFLAKYADSKKVDESLLVQLYHKSCQLDNAVQLCLKSNLLSQLRDVLEAEIQDAETHQNLRQYLSEKTVSMALDSLKSNSTMIDIIIDLILLSKGDKSAIKDVILQSNVEINDKLIEKVENIVDRNKDANLIAILAETALKQGQYSVAAKLYNSIEDRLNSVKALIRTGETSKIIQYANIARDKTVFKIVANYLQTTNYKDEKIIAKFYQKAKATVELERFRSKNIQ